MDEATRSPATLAAQVRALESLIDVHERIVLDQTAKLEASLEEERKARRSLQALDEVARAIASEMQLADVVQLAVDAARELTGAALAAFFFDRDQAHDGRHLLYALSGTTRETFDRLPLPRSTELFGSTFTGDGVLRVDDLAEDRRYQCEAAERGMTPDQLPIRSYLAVPVLAAGGGVEGGLFLGHPEPRVFNAAAESLAVSVARHAAIAIANSRLYEATRRESEGRRVAFEERDRVARVLQRSLLPPSLPAIPGLELAARYEAAGESVGGDFYDVFQIGRGDWGVILGDVCGRGPEAAAVTALTRHTLRTAAMIESSPARVIGILNDALLQSRGERFVTAVFARLTRHDGGYRMRLCAAGHPPVLLAHASGTIDAIEPRTCLLGVYSDIEPVELTVDLESDDVLLLYTDGLIETRRDDETFGEARLARALAEHRHESAQTLADSLLAASQRFATAAVNDDTAFLIARSVSPRNSARGRDRSRAGATAGQA
ncbi:MAG TPA: GAF domain-containing SpoIIE family protein phosphatase [Solirubrobacteraceae bacterium]